ncbi:MAG: HU family DNA-binding protein, partial [Alistipes senegalensis]|nr:HU family DNA-binding protein [Alistipes senegalensis]
MNKKELVRTISQELDPPLSLDRIALVLDKAVEIAKRTLATGEPVRWTGFGSFIVKDIPPRRFYSP